MSSSPVSSCPGDPVPALVRPARLAAPVSARARILDAAEELFAQHGFGATPTSRIAERAGVPKGLIYYYFRRKLDLLVALIERHDEAGPDPASLAVPGDPGLSLRRLVAELDGRAERSTVLRHLLWREADTHGAVREAIADRIDRLVALVRDVLLRSLPVGVASVDLDSAATLVAYAVSYRQSVARHTECEAPKRDKRRGAGLRLCNLDAAVELVGEALLAGLGGPRAQVTPS